MRVESVAEPLTVDELRDLTTFWRVTLRGAGRSDATITVYLRGVRQYLDFCEQKGHLHPINRRSLDAWLAHLRDGGMQGYTARSRLTAVRQFTKWLLREHEIDANPFTDMSQPVIDEKLTEPLDDDQIRALMATCKSPAEATPEIVYTDIRDAAIIQVMVETGMRASEVTGLSMDDVHWTGQPPTLSIRKTKTRRAREAPISAQAAERIGRYLRARRKRPGAADCADFWLGARGDGGMSYAGLYDMLTRRAREAGLENFHPHQMRHTAAHRWLAKGGSESGLMSVAGWQSPQMLMRYTRAQAAARAAEEAQRLNLGEL